MPRVSSEQLALTGFHTGGRVFGYTRVPIESKTERDTRRFVESPLADLQTLFSTEAVTIRAEIAKHVQKITLTPEGHTYVAAGTWDLLGVAAWMVPGARFAPFAHMRSPYRWPQRQEPGAAGARGA